MGLLEMSWLDVADRSGGDGVRTLGELVDRLSIINIKLYVVQDVVMEASQTGKGLDSETVRKLTSLNLERNKAMSDLDRCLRDAVSSGTAEVDERVKLT
jgi:hypothetical protein